jgi:hypothetical protein
MLKFVLEENIDAARLTPASRFVFVRTRSGDSEDTLLASLADVSYLEAKPIESKDLRQRVAGMTGPIADGADTPEAVSTVEFL